MTDLTKRQLFDAFHEDMPAHDVRPGGPPLVIDDPHACSSRVLAAAAWGADDDAPRPPEAPAEEALEE